MLATTVQEECLAFDEGERTSLREMFEHLLREAEKQVRRSERTLLSCSASLDTVVQVPYARQGAERDRQFLLVLQTAAASCRQLGDLNPGAA